MRKTRFTTSMVPLSLAEESPLNGRRAADVQAADLVARTQMHAFAVAVKVTGLVIALNLPVIVVRVVEVEAEVVAVIVVVVVEEGEDLLLAEEDPPRARALVLGLLAGRPGGAGPGLPGKTGLHPQGITETG